MRPAVLLLWVIALGFLAVGLGFLLWPDSLGELIDLAIPTATARADFSATYGGFQVGFGLFLFCCARRPPWVRAGLVAAALALGGFAVGRLYGVLSAPDSPRASSYGFLALEAATSLAAFILLYRLNRQGAGRPE